MRRAAGLLAAILLAIVLAAWLLRFRIATNLVDRRIAAAHVPATYRITRIGPFAQRIEDVRIGDPAAPDLVARRIDLTLGYGLAGPFVTAIHADGVRLRGRIDRDGLSLGALDRLLPQTRGGRMALPDLDLAVRDAALKLATPNGAIDATIDGAGNPQRLFRGGAQITAPALRLGPCALTGLSATLRVTAEGGRPVAQGPVRLIGSDCPGLRLGTGSADVTLSSDRTFEHLAGRAMLAGFGGKAGPASFARIAGRVTAAGAFGNLALNGRIRIAGLSAPAASAGATRSGAAFAGTPFGPTLARATGAAARLLARADAQTDFVAAIDGYRVDLDVRRLILTGDDDARVTAVARGGVGWGAAGWRADADVTTGGGGLPALAIQFRQARAGAPLSGTMRLAPYRVGNARLAADRLRFGWSGSRLSFDTILIADGPLGDGSVRGLELPLQGFVHSDGGFAIDEGCRTFAFRHLQLSGFAFAGIRLPICGRPLLARGSGGPIRIDAATGPVRLDGRTRDGAPVTLGAAALRVHGRHFAAQHVTAALGDPAHPTHLALATLDGRIDGSVPRGTFADAAGAIANVPLALDNGAGDWTYADGALRLTGALRVGDAAAPARFHPLVASDAKLDFASGVIAATAMLREPASNAAVARVDLSHDLARGTGHATLDVDGIRFIPKGLQPDTLTPLTLGVIANVSGIVSGRGRIDWTAAGVTSSGTFGTDRLDLAAAFGPVTGISGSIAFTDLLGLVSAPHQEAKVAEINPGIAVTDGIVRYQLSGQDRIMVESAEWPFAGGMLRLDPTILNFGIDAERHLTFRVEGIDAAAFVQQLDFPNISATGTFDGALPMIFDRSGGRIAGGSIAARASGGTVAYIGKLSDADLGTMGKLAFDALKAIRYSALDISLDGRLDGEMVSRVRMTGVREATGGQSFVTRLIRGLPFRFGIDIRAPFRALVGSARTYADPRALLTQRPAQPPVQSPVQPAASETMP